MLIHILFWRNIFAACHFDYFRIACCTDQTNIVNNTVQSQKISDGFNKTETNRQTNKDSEKTLRLDPDHRLIQS